MCTYIPLFADSGLPDVIRNVKCDWPERLPKKGPKNCGGRGPEI